MEYLTIEGALRLRPVIDENRFATVIQQLQAIPFDREGYVDIERNGSLLTVSSAGEISGDIPHRVIYLLGALKSHAVNDTWVVINRVKWEINVTLAHRTPDTPPWEPFLSDYLKREEGVQIILA